MSSTTAQMNGSELQSQASASSQTAQDFIASQLQLEADAREALPYQFDTCTKALGALRQSLFACLTCTPPPASPHQRFTPAGICYSCSISCHGEHTLVELFSKRDFECDCGTTRIESTPCSLRHNASTGQKGDVKGEKARAGNKYNQNFEGKFCGCSEEYDPEMEKGTMFQCMGLGTVEDGGCGEDWWHPECLMGLPRSQVEPVLHANTGSLETVKEEGEGAVVAVGEEAVPDTAGEPPLPPGFPAEDDFEYLLCYKCVNTQPWIKQYARTSGFLSAVTVQSTSEANDTSVPLTSSDDSQTKKRKAEEMIEDAPDSKKAKVDSEADVTALQSNGRSDSTSPRHSSLPPAPTGTINLFLKEDFRSNLCRCPSCFPRLAKHRHLLEEEETYSPPISESDPSEHQANGAPGSNSGRSAGTGSLLERGEAALSSMDRVKAIEGVMAYNHVRDKVKDFLKPFADSGEAVGAEDIKAYFAKLRGDEMKEREAMVTATQGGGGGSGGDGRREQGGY
ncbi:hypothetical protein LTR86_001961 [Recurvomyces mirabilis]|nr:hypothetical protein LTR86_001961 [Recurvomyces mirabilis]